MPLRKIQNQTAEACSVCLSHGVWKKSHLRSAALHISCTIPPGFGSELIEEQISKGQQVVTAVEGGAQDHCLRRKLLRAEYVGLISESSAFYSVLTDAPLWEITGGGFAQPILCRRVNHIHPTPLTQRALPPFVPLSAARKPEPN